MHVLVHDHTPPDERGFSGPIVARWLDDGANMLLLHKAYYRDSRGRVWTAESGLVFNGLSIPKPLWGRVDSPYTGWGRRPSVFHDAACQDAEVLEFQGHLVQADQLRSDADEMFQDAVKFEMESRGVNPRRNLKDDVLRWGVELGSWWRRVRRR